MTHRALIIVDMQNDFMPGGILAVNGGDKIISLINELQAKFELVVATQDWHPADHKSFASNHQGKKPYDQIILNKNDQVLWPDHCIQGSSGAELHKNLETKKIATIFRKGMDSDIDSYSGFYDNGHINTTGLAGYLREKGVREVYTCGLAGDYCVYFTTIDALQENFETFLLADATRAIDTAGFQAKTDEIVKMGGKVISSLPF